MVDEGIAGDLRYWLWESESWACTCRGAEMFLCDRCLISSSLDAAAAAVDRGDLATAHRAVMRACGIDGRLVPLRDALELLVHPYQSLEVAMARRQDEGVMYECGLSYAAHREIVRDAIRREGEMRREGQYHDEDSGVHLQLYTHPGCWSTFAAPLPEHRPDPEMEDVA